MTEKKYYIIAGEASGDLHGSNLINAIISKQPKSQIRFWGGDEMQKVAGKPVKHIDQLAFMGFIEVLLNIRTILNNIKFCKNDIEAFNPDAIILIDYPGFNMRIAKWAKSKGIKVIYYISPQIWAWKQSRVHQLKKTVDLMLVILPFEKDFYAKFGMEVEFVGHPLIDAIENFQNRYNAEEFKDKYNIDERPILALLPGSRKQEISKKLPVMLKAAREFNNYHIVLAAAPSQDVSFYESFLKSKKNITVVKDGTYELLSIADLAMVTSGTATLETALFKVPQVVCYKGSYISYKIAKLLIKVKYISLVNLILDEEVVKELIQEEFTTKNLVKELKRIEKGESKNKLLEKYDILQKNLGDGGASQKAAQEIIDHI